jgi:hypothetical protein
MMAASALAALALADDFEELPTSLRSIVSEEGLDP